MNGQISPESPIFFDLESVFLVSGFHTFSLQCSGSFCSDTVMISGKLLTVFDIAFEMRYSIINRFCLI